MKKIIIILLVQITCTVGYSQTMDDVYAAEEIVWFGVDYSKTKLIGGFDNPDRIIGEYFSKWNYRIIAHISERYNGKLYDKPFVVDVAAAIVRSEALHGENITTFGSPPPPFNGEQIQEIINLCNSPDNQQGIGLILISNYFGGRNKEAQYSGVYFDIETKKIIQVKNYLFNGSGFGMLPFWDKPLFHTLERIEYEFKTDFASFRFEQRKIARQQKKANKASQK
ncbi:MAG: hypothetical protein JKY53_03325 [Flavobacteriales bacterium]|nr:hypothetical protein [Flavobacteriales bacterium]